MHRRHPGGWLNQKTSHFVRAKVRDAEVNLVYWGPEYMVANSLMKCLATKRFEMLHSMVAGDGEMGVGQPNEHTAGPAGGFRQVKSRLLHN